MNPVRTSPDPAPLPPQAPTTSAQQPAAPGRQAGATALDPEPPATPFATALASAGAARLAQLARRHTAGTLVSVMTHDLSQPLAAIGMYSSAAARMLELGHLDPAELAGVLRHIETQVNRAGDLLTRVRALTRPGDPPAPATDLRRSVTEAVALIRPRAAERQIGLALEVCAEALPVAADPLQVEQVVLALLFNALEAIEAGEAREGNAPADATARQVSVSVGPVPRGALITVRDTGPGIGPAAHARLFAALPSEKRQGCGLALAIGRALIEAQGGALWADPDALGGATLHLRLPIAATAGPPAGAGDPERGAPGTGIR